MADTHLAEHPTATMGTTTGTTATTGTATVSSTRRSSARGRGCVPSPPRSASSGSRRRCRGSCSSPPEASPCSPTSSTTSGRRRHPIPLGVAFILRSARAERIAGLFVVLAIFVSACVVGYEAVLRLLEPQRPDALVALAAAGLIGWLGNLLAARIRTRAGRRLDSPALIADGDHARADAYVSLAVVAGGRPSPSVCRSPTRSSAWPSRS
jgi:hypothetical protein